MTPLRAIATVDTVLHHVVLPVFVGLAATTHRVDVPPDHYRQRFAVPKERS